MSFACFGFCGAKRGKGSFETTLVWSCCCNIPITLIFRLLSFELNRKKPKFDC